MAVYRVVYNLNDGRQITMSGEDAVDFSEQLYTGEIKGEWLICPVDEVTGFQKLIHLSQVVDIDQYHDVDSLNQEEEESDSE